MSTPSYHDLTTHPDDFIDKKGRLMLPDERAEPDDKSYPCWICKSADGVVPLTIEDPERFTFDRQFDLVCESCALDITQKRDIAQVYQCLESLLRTVDTLYDNPTDAQLKDFRLALRAARFKVDGVRDDIPGARLTDIVGAAHKMAHAMSR